MGVVIGKMDGQVEKIFLGNNLTRSTKNYAKILKDKDLSEEEKKRISGSREEKAGRRYYFVGDFYEDFSGNGIL